MATERYTTEEVIKALRQAHGIKAHAAEILECDRHTVDAYVQRHPTVQRVYEDLRETMVDRAERGLLKLIGDGDWPAIKFTLATLGKNRGYSERQELTGPDGEAIQPVTVSQVTVVLPDNARGDNATMNQGIDDDKRD